jgi:hypothetical protein
VVDLPAGAGPARLPSGGAGVQAKELGAQRSRARLWCCLTPLRRTQREPY